MSLRQQFVARASAEGVSITALCREFGISRKTAYKWISRSRADTASALEDHSRRPHHSPRATEQAVVDQILALRQEHPRWGPRKLRRRLLDLGRSEESLPAPSTIAAILRRNGAVAPEEAAKHRPFVRFEREAPNELWQMDFKGDILLGCGERCYPLTVLDDHSRFNLVLRSCANIRTETVRTALIHAFREYGLPERMLMDNGSPWGSDQDHRHTPLTVWLMHLGIAISHGRPYHPQTQGKEERFHRTLREEVIARHVLYDHAGADAVFQQWRQCYNNERPHQAIGFDVPAARYRPSQRPYPEVLPPISYDRDDHVRRVMDKGKISFRGRRLRVGRGFIGYPVALRESQTDGVWDVYFCQFKVNELDLRRPQS